MLEGVDPHLAEPRLQGRLSRGQEIGIARGPDDEIQQELKTLLEQYRDTFTARQSAAVSS